MSRYAVLGLVVIGALGILAGTLIAGPSIVLDPEDRAAVTLLAYSAPTPVPAEDSPVEPILARADHPNVVVAILCTVRKDQLGPWGGHPEASPFLDQLAARGTVFDDLITAAPWTKPAVTALLSGQHAVAVGMVDRGPGRNDRALPARMPTIATTLDRAGWLTIGASANPNITETFGFHRGFDAYQLGLDPDWKDKVPGTVLVDAVVDELARRREAGDRRAFYLQLVLLDAHARRTASGDEVARFEERGVPYRVLQYRAHVRRVDDALARLDQRLRDLGVADDTIVVVVADHGEGLDWPAHHGHAHGLFFGSSTVHVPWVIAGPGVQAGHRILGTVSGVDVAPTVLGLVGPFLPDPVAGRDLSDLVRGTGRVAPDKPAFVDTWFADASRVASVTRTHLCQLGVRDPARAGGSVPFLDGCFDRATDPLATRPLRVPPPRWSELLRAWRAAQTAAAAGIPVEDARVDPALAAHLEALGYVDGADGTRDTK